MKFDAGKLLDSIPFSIIEENRWISFLFVLCYSILIVVYKPFTDYFPRIILFNEITLYGILCIITVITLSGFTYRIFSTVNKGVQRLLNWNISRNKIIQDKQHNIDVSNKLKVTFDNIYDDLTHKQQCTLFNCLFSGGIIDLNDNDNKILSEHKFIVNAVHIADIDLDYCDMKIIKNYKCKLNPIIYDSVYNKLYQQVIPLLNNKYDLVLKCLEVDADLAHIESIDDLPNCKDIDIIDIDSDEDTDITTVTIQICTYGGHNEYSNYNNAICMMLQHITGVVYESFSELTIS